MNDVGPGYTGVSPFNYPLDCQGHVALKLHSGTTAYSSYIGLVSTGLVYPQKEDPNVQINQYSYFNIIGLVPPIANHGIQGCLYFFPLVSNVFLAHYDSGTSLSHLTDGGYGFDTLGSPGIDMYQMYIVAPVVKAGMTYIWPHLQTSQLVCWRRREMCHIPQDFLPIDVKVRSMWLPVRHTSFERGGVWVLSITQ